MDNYKEKYEQAVKKIRNLFEEGEKKGYTIVTYRKNFEEIFPEFAESEDERIRKELIEHCRNTRCVTEEGAEIIVKWIAWLEKQGEQKPAKIEVNAGELSDFERSLKHIIEEAIEDGDIHNLKADADMLLRIAHKSAWSEEDKKMLDRLLKHFEWTGKYRFDKKDCDEARNWLKSLRPNHWKPSKEQMKQLGWIAKQNKDNMIGKELISLYQDLKKLREE